MPELPEVEIISKHLYDHFCGRKLVNVIGSRVQKDLLSMKGKNLSDVMRWGKALLLDFENNLVEIHLRITGKVVIDKDVADEVICGFRFEGIDEGIFILDKRRLASVRKLSSVRDDRFLSTLGPDPLKSDINEDYFVSKVKKIKRQIKLVLMDQKIVSGIGNIYAAEILFHCRINPFLPCNSLSDEKLSEIWRMCKKVLKDAVDRGFVSDKYFVCRLPNCMLAKNSKEDGFYVYGRDNMPCKVCGAKIEAVKQSGRTTYFCPVCQKK